MEDFGRGDSFGASALVVLGILWYWASNWSQERKAAKARAAAKAAEEERASESRMAVATAFLKRTYPEFWSEYVRWEPTQRLKRIQEVSNLLAEIQAQQAAIDQIRNPKDDAADRARFNLEAKPHFDKITDCFRQMTRPLQP